MPALRSPLHFPGLVRPFAADKDRFLRHLSSKPTRIAHDIPQIRSILLKVEMTSWQWGRLPYLIWNDSKTVLLLSTHQRVDRLTSIPSINGHPSVTLPTVAVDFNYNKGHVDQVDLLRSYCVVQRRDRFGNLSLAECRKVGSRLVDFPALDPDSGAATALVPFLSCCRVICEPLVMLRG
jgi:hypothetical protein